MNLGQPVIDVRIDSSSGTVAARLQNGKLRLFSLPQPDLKSYLPTLERRVRRQLGLGRAGDTN